MSSNFSPTTPHRATVRSPRGKYQTRDQTAGGRRNSTVYKQVKRLGKSLPVGIEGREREEKQGETEPGQDGREEGESQGVNCEVTNAESAEQLVARTRTV